MSGPGAVALTAKDIVGKRRWPGIVVTALVTLSLGIGVGWWGARVLFAPPPDVLQDPGFVVMQAARGAVGQHLDLRARVTWESTAVLAFPGEGTVTAVPEPGEAPAAAGDVLFSVDLRPVVIAQGAVPSFRDLHQGMSGADVAQLQGLLGQLGFLEGDADGTFGARTKAAVEQWQRSLGLRRSDQLGTVLARDVLYVAELPARIRLTQAVDVGGYLDARQAVVEVLDARPSFAITLSDSQAQMVTPGMGVVIDHDAHQWEAVVGTLRPASDEEPAVALLHAPGDEALCEDACASLPTRESVLLPARVEVVPSVEAVTVPAAAIVTDASGATGVTLTTGERIPVTILASAQGMTAVEGLEEGTGVRVTGP